MSELDGLSLFGWLAVVGRFPWWVVGGVGVGWVCFVVMGKA